MYVCRCVCVCNTLRSRIRSTLSSDCLRRDCALSNTLTLSEIQVASLLAFDTFSLKASHSVCAESMLSLSHTKSISTHLHPHPPSPSPSVIASPSWPPIPLITTRIFNVSIIVNPHHHPRFHLHPHLYLPSPSPPS